MICCPIFIMTMYTHLVNIQLYLKIFLTDDYVNKKKLFDRNVGKY